VARSADAISRSRISFNSPGRRMDSVAIVVGCLDEGAI
jgi:hypothetical protein